MKRPVRVLIVDDSAVYREFLRHLLSSDADIEVAGAVRDGRSALDACAALRPDVITMDIHMPDMDGFDVTRRIMETVPTPIVVVSAVGDSGEVGMSFRAVESGALALVPKPRGASEEQDAGVRELVQTVKLMAEVKVVRRWPRRPSAEVPAAGPDRWLPEVGSGRMLRRGAPEAVLIGASTGGPLPIRAILSALPRGFPVPVLIVQHIAAGFVAGFVEWLAGAATLPVRLAADGESISAGTIYVAPDGAHMGVGNGMRIRLERGEPEHGLRPSVSHLFRSAARVYGSRAVGVLLSGMGVDGAAELKALRDGGAMTFAQDEETCVVFGMPGEAVKLQGATYVMAPDVIGAAIVAMIGSTNGRQET